MSNEIRQNYKVLRPIGFGGERRRAGDIVSMFPSEATNLGPDYVEIIETAPTTKSVTTDNSNVEVGEVVKPKAKKAKK